MLWKSFIRLLLIAYGFSSMVESQSIQEIVALLPASSLDCFVNNLLEAQCSFTNTTLLQNCACSNITLQSSISTCIQTTNTFDEQIKAANVSSQLCADFPKESKTREIQTLGAIGLVLSVLFLGLRVYSRLKIAYLPLQIDDWTAIAVTALIAALSCMALASKYVTASFKNGSNQGVSKATKFGFGMHHWNINPQNAKPLLQLYYVVQMFYILAKVMVKASIALLIDRIFPIRWMRRATICFIVLLITHNLVFLFLIIFQCKPISSIWDKHITGSCLNLTAIAYAGASLSIVEYIVLILLPIPELWKLKAKLGRRIQLIFVFTLASFATVASAIRLEHIIISKHTYDVGWTDVEVIMWSLIELLSAAICCHLPPLRPLLRTISASKYWSSGMMFLKKNLGKIPSFRLSVEKASGSFSVTLIIRRRKSDDGLIELSRSDGTSTTMPTSKQVPVPTSQLRRQSFSYSVTGLFATVGAARRDLMTESSASVRSQRSREPDNQISGSDNRNSSDNCGNGGRPSTAEGQSQEDLRPLDHQEKV